MKMACYHGKNNEIEWSYCEECPVNEDCPSCPDFCHPDYLEG